MQCIVHANEFVLRRERQKETYSQIITSEVKVMLPSNKNKLYKAYSEN